MQTELIKLAHEKGHFSSTKTEEILTKSVGKKEGFLNPIPKEDVPLSTYHVDFIGPLPSTNKRYQHILTIIDAFTKFTWLYPVKSTTLEDALDKLKLQQKTFGNPKRIITDRGSPFNSKGFDDYCTEEKIQNLQITTGVPRGNGQVERIHRTLIPVLTKLSIDDPTKWYKFVDRLQRILNSTSNRSTKWSPFELLTGVTMRNKEDLYLRNLLMEEMVEELQEQRNQLRQDAKRNIQKIQAENKRTYDRKRKKAPRYQKGDLVAIQRTQFGSGLKLRPKFLGPYKVIEVKPRDRYLSPAFISAQRAFAQPTEFLHGTLSDEHRSHDQEKGGNGKESTEEFIFPKKTARSVSPTSTQDPIVTSNNFSDLEQDVEHPLPTTNQVTAEVVTPKIKLPHPIMLKIKKNFREQIKRINEKFPNIRNRTVNDVVKMFTNHHEEYRNLIHFLESDKDFEFYIMKRNIDKPIKALTTILQSTITSKADNSCTPIGPPLLKSRPPLQTQASNTTNIRVPDRGLKAAGAA
ncbi:hypothetical protein TNCV_4779431 [Trichonephila clavipes]|nr:hypothetical protein TNCV_4779431 [Trichonephila clavipes]